MDKPDEVKQLEMDYTIQFGSPAGERILDDLKRVGGYNKSLYEIGDDVNSLAYLEGRRSIVLHILDMIKNKE